MGYFFCLRNFSSKYGPTHHLTSFSCAQICSWDSSGGPLANTQCSPRKGPQFNPWSGNYIPHAVTNIYNIYYTHTYTHTHVCVCTYINMNCLCDPSEISAPWRPVCFAHGVSRVSGKVPGKIGGAQLIFLFFLVMPCGMQDLSNRGLNLGPLNCGILTTGPPEKSLDK